MIRIMGQSTGVRFAAAIARYPLRFALLSLLLIVACASGIRFLQPDFTYRAFFQKTDPLRVQVERFDYTFGSDDSIVLIVHNPSGIVNPESADLILSLTQAMWLVPDIVRVESLSNFRWVRARGDDILVDAMIPDEGLRDPAVLKERRAAIAAEPLIPEYLLSADGKTTMVVGYVQETPERSPDPVPIVEAVREMIKSHASDNHEFHITGRIAIMAGMQESAQADAGRTLPIVFVTIVLLMALATGRLGGIVGTVLLIVTSIVATMGVAGWMGMSISNITAMVPQFILAIGVAVAVHVLVAFYQKRRAGLDTRPAVEAALAETFVPTFLSSSTTAIAFLSFLATEITAIGNLGAMVGIGVMLTWILTYMFVGSYLALAPELRLRRGAPSRVSPEPHAPRHEAWVSGVVDRVVRYKFVIVISAFVLGLGAIVLSSSNTINANPFRYFDEDFWLRQSADFSEAHLRGSQGIEVVVHSGRADGVKDPEFLQRVEKFQNWLNEQEYVAKTVSIIDFLKQANRALHGDDEAHYALPATQQEISELLFLYSVNLPEGLDLSNRVSLESDKLRISVRWTLYDSAHATEQAVELERVAKTLGLEIETTGKMLLFQRMNSYVAQSLFISLGISLLAISAILTLVFRSVKMGIVALLGNVMPLGIGLAVLTLANHDIDTGAVVALAVCLGVVVDDTIHLLLAIHNSGARSMREAIVSGMTRVLPAITLTSVILVVGFGAFMMGDFVPNQNFGLLAVTILLSGYFFDVIFLPALLLVLSSRSSTLVATLGVQKGA